MRTQDWLKMMMVGAVALRTVVASETPTISYENPVWDGYLADPYVFKSGDAWYAIGTGNAAEGKQFPMLRSTNFTDWEPVGSVLDKIEGIEEYWAPEIAEKDGKFYLYWAGNRKMRVAVSDHPTGPFRDTGKWMFPDLEFSIDGHAFKDPQSVQWYFFFAKDFFDLRPGTALAVVKLGDDMMTPEGETTTVMRAFADWQIYERDRDLYGKKWKAWHTVEGPAVVFREGQYYLFYSGGNWQTPGYGVGCATSATVTGPYVDAVSKDEAAVIHTIPGELIGPGHNSVVLGPDDTTYFNVYHSWNGEQTRRQMCLDPLQWTSQGAKTVNPGRGKKTVTLPLAE
ncbi:beta-xylosidase [Haloferula luteola]|uniref:Beta-xylosidase n=1 Tax=Haloferula luteola TaxID=595692 RepID=A0A840UZY8_9BACT|nr:glycoside hydrolase family 43 protein [Haloferula luteola]MBB5351677.1 beta-xylosidase [Haloferula luteola]